MITKNFEPNYFSDIFRRYNQDDDVWKGNKPLCTHSTWEGISILEKDMKTKKELIRYEFNFGNAILFFSNEDNKLRVFRSEISLCDGWRINIYIPLSNDNHVIQFTRITHREVFLYNMQKDMLQRFTSGYPLGVLQAPFRELDEEERNIIENILKMEVDDCKIFNIIKEIMNEEYRKVRERKK